VRRTRAVLFDVDFTLIYPGPTFQGVGYQEFCARHGIRVDPRAFERAVADAAAALDPGEGVYDQRVYIDYTRRIIEGMGGSGEQVETVAREIFSEWAGCHHFIMYDEVPQVLRTLRASGVKIGLISNSERCMASFQAHFELQGLVDTAITSVEHGYMKPHPSIFEAALRAIGAERQETVMVGDSLHHDVEGARRLGMRAVLVRRSGPDVDCPPDVPVISTLDELPPLL
jgi:HAD superfamily hydrolase (TIGR01662 family)